MSGQDAELTPVTERSDYPPLLNVVLPAIILVVSAAYAWSLRDVVNPAMNLLLLLGPLFVATWMFLSIVFVEDVIPSVREHGERGPTLVPKIRAWHERFAPGTEAGVGLVVAATFLFSFFGPGDGPLGFLVSTFLYLAVAGYLIGDRELVRLIVQAALCSIGLYLIMGVALGVRL